MDKARRIQRRWLVFTVLGALAFVALYWIAVLTPQGQAVENSGLRGADLAFGRGTASAAGTLEQITPIALVIGTIAVALIALIRRRPALVLAAVGSIVLTTVATRVLKNWVLDRPILVDASDAYTSGSFPSGHTAAAVSVVFALAMVVPAGARAQILVLGGAVVVAVGNITMAASWHRASDVLGADLVAFVSVSIACAWLAGRARVATVRKPPRRGIVRLVVAAAVVAALCLVVLAIEGIQYFPNDTKDLTAFVVMQLLGVSTSTLAVAGFSIASRGLDVGGRTQAKTGPVGLSR